MSLRNADWNFSLMEEFIEARGERVIHETGVACTCRNGDYYASTINREGFPASRSTAFCTKCRGEGWVYRDAKIIKGIVTGVNPTKDRKLLESGYVTPGDAIFSPSIQTIVLHDFDKLTFMFAVPLSDGQVIMRGAATLDANAQLKNGVATNEDRLWYMPHSALWCEDEDGVVYQQGVDFSFKDKKIVWAGGPDTGKLYALKYSGYVEWIAYVSPMARFDRNRNIGQRVVLRKKHIAFEYGGPDDTPAGRENREVEFTSRTKV